MTEPAHPPRPDDPPLFALLNEIGIIEQLARNRFDAAQPDGLRLSQFIVLNHLVRLGDGTTPVALARAFQLAKGAITNTLHRLEERGFIRLAPDPADGRGKRVWLTEAGRARRQEAVAWAVHALADAGAAMPAETAAAMLPALRALRLHLDRFRARDGAG
jgi:DNA-binding MarR family transcriptional regulator